MKLSYRQEQLLQVLTRNSNSSLQVVIHLLENRGVNVLKHSALRDINSLVKLNLITKNGKGPSTNYSLTKKYSYIVPISLDGYYKTDIDSREIQEYFNFEIFNDLADIDIFSEIELTELEQIHIQFLQRKKMLTKAIIKKEFERITIELSWKSSAIEGNTYSLLETEALLMESRMAPGKDDSEAVMLINHKKALDYIRENPKYFQKISLGKIEEVHRILIKDLGITNNIRSSLVGIAGTRFKPIDNDAQIRDAVNKMCKLVNSIDNMFVKSFLSLILTAYIQPFEDGNKRTSRLLANAMLISNGSFPLAFRSIDIIEYKEAMLVFYETNNLSVLKEMFIEQVRLISDNYWVTS